MGASTQGSDARGSSGEEIPENTLKRMRELNIDIESSARILKIYNSGVPTGKSKGKAQVPPSGHSSVVDLSGESHTLDAALARERARELGIDISLIEKAPLAKGRYEFSPRLLEEIGLRLYPLTAFGVLNGGSATSYVDRTRNQTYNPSLFDLFERDFERLRELSLGMPKALAPAYINPDGSLGDSFLLLKLRGILTQTIKYRRATGDLERAALPIFQMTSERNEALIASALEEYSRIPSIARAAAESKSKPWEFLTGIQRMIVAYTHSEEGRPKRVFDKAGGKPGEVLPLPGGHGQNFSALESQYRELRSRGIRFAYLGNVDNLGFTANPRELALLALSGARAGFDFSHKTPLDQKGGILVCDDSGRLSCADIGQSIDAGRVASFEAEGRPILFNCATGLFDLDYLVSNLASVRDALPIRFSDQVKDIGRYSQAELNTWEIIGALDNFLIFAVNKYERFLSAKMILETLITSGLRPGELAWLSKDETASPELKAFGAIAPSLNEGLRRALREEYGLRFENGSWLA